MNDVGAEAGVEGAGDGPGDGGGKVTGTAVLAGRDFRQVGSLLR